MFFSPNAPFNQKKNFLSCLLPLPENMHEVSPCALNAKHFFTTTVDKIK
jgi:hypothetical protein